MSESNIPRIKEIMQSITEKEVVTWVNKSNLGSICSDIEEIFKNMNGSPDQKDLAITKIAYIAIAIEGLKSAIKHNER